MTQQELELPKGWVKTTLGKVSELYVPMRDKPKKFDGNIPWLRIDDFDGKYAIDSKSNQRVSQKTVDEMNLKIYPTGTVLCSCSATIGVCAITKNKLVTNQTFIGIFPNKSLYNEFLYYNMLTQTNYLTNIGTGNTIKYISRKKFENLPIKIPPQDEQKRIVSKIEELFSKIDSTKKSLEYTKLQLEQYTHSLLKSAFEGKIPSAKIIFEKSNWEHTTYGEISKKITYGFTNPMPDSTNGPWKITATNIKNNRIEYDGARKTDLKSYQKLITEKSRPKKDIILITKDGTLGNTAIVDRDDICINQSIASIESDKSKVVPKFLMFSLQRPMVKQFIEKYKRATTIAHISITDLAKWELDLPTINEQQEIVSQIEQGFSLIENSQSIVNSTLQTLETMRMSVLKQAFEGKLVPQDPNDEPASILLEKIKKAQVDLKPKQGRAKNVK